MSDDNSTQILYLLTCQVGKYRISINTVYNNSLMCISAGDHDSIRLAYIKKGYFYAHRFITQFCFYHLLAECGRILQIALPLSYRYMVEVGKRPSQHYLDG